MFYIYLSGVWYAPGAEFDLPARLKRSKRDPPLCGARPETLFPFENGFWNECFFSIVFIKINVSNFGILLTTALISSSLIWTNLQLSSSDGKGDTPFAVTQTCSYIGKRNINSNFN